MQRHDSRGCTGCWELRDLGVGLACFCLQLEVGLGLIINSDYGAKESGAGFWSLWICPRLGIWNFVFLCGYNKSRREKPETESLSLSLYLSLPFSLSLLPSLLPHTLPPPPSLPGYQKHSNKVGDSMPVSFFTCITTHAPPS